MLVKAMSKADDAKFEIEKIRKDMRKLQFLIDQATRQLNTVNRLKLPESTPYFSFKTADKIEDLKGSGLGLRAALQNDILQGKMTLRLLELEAKRLKRGDYEALVARQHDALLQADRNADRKARAIIDQAAQKRGYLTEAEFIEVQDGMLKGLKAHLDFLRHHPSRQNLKETLDKLGQVYSMGMDDADTSKVAMEVVQSSARKLVDDAKKVFLKKPSPAAATALIGEIANNELLGGESAMAYIDAKIVPKLKELAEAAERRFRATPTKENCEAMIDADYAYRDAGGPGLPDPPRGLRRIKQGTTRPFGPKDMLSAVSKEYYGSFSYWDVIVKANHGVFRDPDRPQANTTITIPH